MISIENVNGTNLDPALLIEASRVHAELPQSSRADMAACTIAFIEMLREWGFEGKEARNLLLAINFRMEALSYLLLQGHREVKGWSFDGSGPEMVFVEEELVRTAADEPLIEVDGQARFDPDSFFKRLLRISSHIGEA